MSGLAVGLPVDKGGVVEYSEFWNAVETVLGPAYGRSLVQDLVLPGLGVICVQALDDGVAPEQVWGLLREGIECSDVEWWIFRSGPRR